MAKPLIWVQQELDPDALNYIKTVETADSQGLEATWRNALNTFFIGAKSDGFFPSLKGCAILAGARTLTGALTPLAGPALTIIGSGSSNYNRKAGLAGDGAAFYINTNRAGNADPQNSSHLIVYITTAATGGSQQAAIGYGNGASSDTLIVLNAPAANYPFRSRGIISTQSRSTVGAVGFVGLNRSSAVSFTSSINSTEETISLSSSVPTSDNIFLFGRSLGSLLPTNARIAFFSSGTSLNLSIARPRITALMNALATIP
jgi:hypothetical protein